MVRGRRSGVETDDGAISALAVFDDGTGEALYATGTFSQIGGVAAEGIAKFDGVSWQPLGGAGAAGLTLGGGKAMAVYDDGVGPALYVGGSFATAGGVEISSVARWEGSTWSNVGMGMPASALHDVLALEVFGGELYAGGMFTQIDGVTAAHIARWNGTAWSDVGGGISHPPPQPAPTSVTSLRTIDLGAGAIALRRGGIRKRGSVVGRQPRALGRHHVARSRRWTARPLRSRWASPSRSPVMTTARAWTST